MRDSKEVTLKEALEKMIDVYKLRGKMNEYKIDGMWEKVMGEVISKQTRSLSVTGKTLYVKIDSSSMRQELHYLRDKIKARLNEELGSRAIEDIVFI